MARYNEGIMGPVSGTIGPVEGSSWNGIKYLRSRKASPKLPPTQKQLEQRMRLGMLSTFLYSMSELLDKTFATYAIKKTGTNCALGLAYKRGIKGDYPDFTINYKTILIARGSITNVGAAAVTASANQILDFSWADNSETGNATESDKAILVSYCEETCKAIYSMGAGERSSGSAQLKVSEFAGYKVHIWLSFISADGNDVATSIYLGQVQVSS